MEESKLLVHKFTLNISILILLIYLVSISRVFFLLIPCYLYIVPIDIRRKDIEYFKHWLNPYFLIQSIRHLYGHYKIEKHNDELSSGESTHRVCSSINYTLPFAGKWLVANGGNNKDNSHSWEVYNQRFAYDFLIVDKNGNSHKGSGKYLEDYYCFDKKVIAPAKGLVVKVVNNVNDFKKLDKSSIDWSTRDFRGNHIIIEHSPKEYSFLAHFKMGSIIVKVGQLVERGDFLGSCGNSGHSTEPHIHFHVQDRKNFYDSVGIPIQFCNSIINDQFIKISIINKGDIVSN